MEEPLEFSVHIENVGPQGVILIFKSLLYLVDFSIGKKKAVVRAVVVLNFVHALVTRKKYFYDIHI